MPIARISKATLFVLPFAWLLAGPAVAAELSAEEKETARQVEVALKHLETNLKLAQDTAGAGTAPLSGAKAKLTAVRLQPAKDALPAATERLKKLPADHADVIALQKRADAGAAAIAALQARIDGKTAPPPNTPAGAVKLDYKQEESLKNAKFILREIEGARDALEKVIADIKPIDEVNKIDYRLIQRAMNSIAFARQRNGFMTDHMSKVPANGVGVAPVADAWKAAMASIDASEKALAPIHKQLTDLVNPAGYPQFDADVKRLGELAGQYGYTERFVVNREQAAELVRQAPAAKEELARVLKAYAWLVYQKTEQGEQLAKLDSYFQAKFAAFTAAAESQKKSLPAEIRDHIAAMNRLADQAVKEQKPAFFTGGIQQQIDEAGEKLTLLAALDPDTAKAVTVEIEQTRAELRVKQKSLHNAIIAANELPPDRYTAADRQKLSDLATATWRKQQPDAMILAIRIPSEKWARSTIWRYFNKSWYLVDHSKLQVQLIVKHEAGLAVIRPINLWIDHTSGDKLSASAMDDIKDELIPQRMLPAAKVK